MTRQKLFSLYQTLSNTKNKLNFGSVKFKFMFIKNLKNLENLVTKEQEILQECIKPSDKLVEFEQKRLKLLNEYGEKTEQGTLKQDVSGNAIIPDEKKDEFNVKMSELTQEYKDVLEERSKQLQEYNNLLNEDIDISNLDLAKFKLSTFPDDIPMEVLDALYELDLIEED